MNAPATTVPQPTGKQTRQNQQVLDLPQQREATLRPGVAWEFKRDEYTTALIAQTVGTERIPGCTKCIEGRGPFSSCVTVAGFFDGTCANCIHSGRRKRCTLRNVSAAVLPGPVVLPGPAVVVAPAARRSTVRVPVRGAFPAPSPTSVPALAETFEYLPRSPRALARLGGFEFADSNHYAHGIGPYPPFWLTPSGGHQVDGEEEVEEDGDDDDDDDDDDKEEEEEERMQKKMRIM